VHDVALEELQDRVELEPEVILAGEAVRETVGRGLLKPPVDEARTVFLNHFENSSVAWKELSPAEGVPAFGSA